MRAPIFCESTGEIVNSYQAYLRTKHWTNIRLDLIEEKCLICEGGNTQIHHLNYDHLGCEEPGDLIALCGRHHMAIHGLRKNGKPKKKKKYRVVKPRLTKKEKKQAGKNKKKRRKKGIQDRMNRKTCREGEENGLKYIEKEENGFIIKTYITHP